MKTKEYDYFGYFILAAEIAVKCGSLLGKTLVSFNEKEFPERKKAMHDLEHQADGMRHDMTEHLAHEFITPIERNDLAALAVEFDNVIDCIDDIMLCIYMYNVHTLRPEVTEFTDLIGRITTALYRAAEEFPNYKKSSELSKHLIEINRLESLGDELFCKSIRSLYESECSDREVMIWTKLYEDFEACLDACEDCADIMEGIVMNNI